jgi:hypothetical protein
VTGYALDNEGKEDYLTDVDESDLLYTKTTLATPIATNNTQPICTVVRE